MKIIGALIWLMMVFSKKLIERAIMKKYYSSTKIKSSISLKVINSRGKDAPAARDAERLVELLKAPENNGLKKSQDGYRKIGWTHIL